MPVSHIDTVILYVADQQKMVDFFTGRLGLEKRTDAEMRPGQRWIEVLPRGAQTSLAILAAGDFGSDPDKGYPLTFQVADLEAAGAELERAGVEVSGIVDEAWGRYRTAGDPEGRSFMLVSPKR